MRRVSTACEAEQAGGAAHVADAAQAAELMLLLCAGRAAVDTGNDGLAGVAADLLASAVTVTALLGGQTLAKGLTGAKAMPTSLKRDLRALDGAASFAATSWLPSEGPLAAEGAEEAGDAVRGCYRRRSE